MKIISLLIMLLSFDFPFNFPVDFPKNNSLESQNDFTRIEIVKIYNDEDLQKMIQTDKEFSKMSEDIGFPAAFIHYADENVIKMNPGREPYFGKEELTKAYSEPLPNNKIKLVWEPVKAEISSSGDLGYTFGNWVMNTLTKDGKDTVVNGVYVSIWKKQADGNWKYVLDGGNVVKRDGE